MLVRLVTGGTGVRESLRDSAARAAKIHPEMTDLPPTSNLPPPPPSSIPPPTYQPPPASFPPPGMPGQGAPPILPGAFGAGAFGIYQFTGSALWSIGFGVVSIAAPFFINIFFIVLPIIGFFYGVRAIRQGRVIGGVAGLVLNVLGGIVSLFASGLI